jgi:hypothetical protein
MEKKSLRLCGMAREENLLSKKGISRQVAKTQSKCQVRGTSFQASIVKHGQVYEAPVRMIRHR